MGAPTQRLSATLCYASVAVTALCGQQCQCRTALSESNLETITSRPIREAPLVSDMGRSFGIPHPYL